MPKKGSVWTFCSSVLWRPLQPISCVVRAALTNQRSGNIRAAGWSDGNPISDAYPLQNWYNDPHYHIEHFFCIFFYHSFDFKNFNEWSITKGLKRCHSAPCIVNDGWPAFPSFLFLSRNAAFVVVTMLKHRSFQSRFLSMPTGGVISDFWHSPTFSLLPCFAFLVNSNVLQ